MMMRKLLEMMNVFLTRGKILIRWFVALQLPNINKLTWRVCLINMRSLNEYSGNKGSGDYESW